MKSFLKKISTFSLSAYLFLVAAQEALAQQVQPQPAPQAPGGTTGLTNPAIGDLGNDPTAAAEGSIFVSYFISIWRAIINIGAILVIIYFLWGAIEWITAGGDASKVEKARSKFVNAIIGLVLLVASFAIIGFISLIFFGEFFNILSPEFIAPGGSNNLPANLGPAAAQ